MNTIVSCHYIGLCQVKKNNICTGIVMKKVISTAIKYNEDKYANTFFFFFQLIENVKKKSP